ncbi:tRNA (adenine37-N(6))-methyltransferase TrmN6 [Labilithrix luteola]|uniref:tRNA (Adenine37-N(6))-methyltransferase TrmN6 n=1 Tax=Labilithrix luteola TaxID=1391654 RepID=A0A0K1QE74_9BACT|nr:methyltransferase [Labilithrix luteola]AKV04064.1 tRNA (adenine37-N(6))-methyltransferase TrmN6 [Labilithrix luteola]
MTISPEAFEGRRLELEAELGEPITVDGLTASWSIFQRKKGHRHSTDDLLTGWYALEKSPPVMRCLDLGTGIGTVGMLVLSGMPEACRLTCVEAQDISYRFLRENLAANEVEARVRPLHGDLRNLALDERFPLVTGSPPYFDVSAGIVPADSQKAHARFELRGDVRDYAKAAKRHLEPDGLFVFCFPWAQKARAVAAAHDEGFSILTDRDVVPREGLIPLFSLFACKLGAHPELTEPPFVVRHADGTHTPAMRAVRARFGWPVD